MVYIPQNILDLLKSKNVDHFDDSLWPIAKLSLVGTKYTWLITHIDPYNSNIAYGLFDEGNGIESGIINLQKLDDLHGPNLSRKDVSNIFTKHELEQPIVIIDIDFVSKHSLSVYRQVAQELGLIHTDTSDIKIWNRYGAP